MAISVAPSSLTAAEAARRTSGLTSRRTSMNTAAANRASLIRQLAVARRRGATGAIGSLMKRIPAANRAVANYQKQYGQYKSQDYTPFYTSYNRLGALDKGNPALQGVLDKLMPFDPQGASDRIGAQQTLNQRLLAIKQGKDQLSEDYSTGVRNLETEEPNRLRGLLGNYAGRGLAFSSGYGDALGQEQQDYTRQRTALDTGNQRGQAAAALDEGGAQSDFQSRLASILFGTTSRLSENAGTLGMAGNADLPLLLELARRRLTSGAAAG